MSLYREEEYSAVDGKFIRPRNYKLQDPFRHRYRSIVTLGKDNIVTRKRPGKIAKPQTKST